MTTAKKETSTSQGGAPRKRGGQGPLGIYAKYVGQTSDTLAQDSRKRRYTLQRVAAKLLPKERIRNCHWAVASNFYGVDVVDNRAEKKARFNGLQTCGSVWHCPCCSGSITNARKDEVNHALAWGRKKGYYPLLLTLTASHHHAHLLTFLNQLKNAKRRMQQHRTWKTLKVSIVGSITATEITYGENGWHPHFHIILFVKASSEVEAMNLVRGLEQPWLSSLKKEGLWANARGFDVQNGSKAGDYVTKWGVAEEIALGSQKSGQSKGRTPFQLLEDCSNGDINAGKLFQEFAITFKGRCQLVWSNKLKKLADIKERTDEQAAEDAVRLADLSKNDVVVGHFTPKVWAKVRHERSAILKIAELAQSTGVDAIVKLLKNKKSKPAAPDLVQTPKPRPPQVPKAQILPMYQKFNNHPLIKEWADEWDRTGGGLTK